MRFSVAVKPAQPLVQPLRTATAADLIHRLVFGEPLPRPESSPEQAGSPRNDLDQRVREAGEW